jgi:hypothetical protein
VDTWLSRVGSVVIKDVGCGVGCGDWFDRQPAEPMINNIANTTAQEPFGIMVWYAINAKNLLDGQLSYHVKYFFIITQFMTESNTSHRVTNNDVLDSASERKRKFASFGAQAL